MIPRKKLKTYLQTREDQVRARWEEKQRGNSLQQTFTPFSLTYEMLERLPSLEGKDVLVIANMETFYLLKYLKVDGYINFNSVTLLTDIKELEGKDGVSYNSFDELDKVDLGMKFDVVIGNPPYQITQSKAKRAGTSIWHLFVLKMFDDMLADGGSLSMIHPNGWRNGRSRFKKVLNLFNTYNPKYIALSNYTDGLRYFGVGTTCDWYVLEKTLNCGKTTVRDVECKESFMDTSSISLLPDANIEKCFGLLAAKEEEKVDLLLNPTAYHTQGQHMSKEESEEFRYPVAYTITQKRGLSCWWSSDNTRGHFGIPKVIVSKGAGCYPILDQEGKYGLTQFTYAITDTPENLPKIKQAMETQDFLDLMKDLGSGNDRYTREALSSLKKDFWKEFVD